jgi:hypothetical protein
LADVDRQRRLVSGAIAWSGYLFGGWLLLSRLVPGGSNWIDQSAPDASPVLTSVHAPAVALADRGATTRKLLIVSIVDGPSYTCMASADLVTADEIQITSSDFVSVSPALDCT